MVHADSSRLPLNADGSLLTVGRIPPSQQKEEEEEEEEEEAEEDLSRESSPVYVHTHSASNARRGTFGLSALTALTLTSLGSHRPRSRRRPRL